MNSLICNGRHTRLTATWQTIPQYEKKNRIIVCRLSQECSWNLRSSGMCRWVTAWLVSDVSGKRCGFIFNGRNVHRPLKMRLYRKVEYQSLGDVAPFLRKKKIETAMLRGGTSAGKRCVQISSILEMCDDPIRYYKCLLQWFSNIFSCTTIMNKTWTCFSRQRKGKVK
jgi:hypothetical protein